MNREILFTVILSGIVLVGCDDRAEQKNSSKSAGVITNYQQEAIDKAKDVEKTIMKKDKELREKLDEHGIK